MAVTWNPSDKDAAWGLSGSDMVGTRTGSGTWLAMRATHGINADNPNGIYFEIVLTNAWTNLMIGVSKLTDTLTTYNQAGQVTAYSPGGTYGTNGTPGTATPTFGTAGDRIGFLVRAGKVWIRKNGTWTGDPAAGTGFMMSNVAGTVYPIAIGYAPSGGIVTLCANRTDITGSLPTNASPLDSTFSLTTTLVDASNSPLASTAVKWAVFLQTTPDTLLAPESTGSGTTDGSGVLTISYTTTGVPIGGTCGVLISTTAGTADTNCRSSFIPRAPTVT